MYVGAHVSIAGGIELSPERAANWGCEVFQTFSRSPQGGPAPKLTPDVVKSFKNNCRKFGLKAHYIHTPYYINFASTNNRIRYGTINVIRDELERGTLLGTEYVMTHLGSAREVGLKAGLEMTVEGMVKILKDYKGTAQLLIEIAAGSGETLGDTFEEIATVIEQTEKKLKRKNVLNVCFDTQHAFASGYDLRTAAAIKDTVKKFDTALGLERLRMSHCNDSKVEFGKHVDRHANLGTGHLDLAAFKAIIAEPKLKNMHLILETPRDEKGTEIKKEIKLLKSFRDKK
jgi:deoxyribonuclease IV